MLYLRYGREKPSHTQRTPSPSLRSSPFAPRAIAWQGAEYNRNDPSRDTEYVVAFPWEEAERIAWRHLRACTSGPAKPAASGAVPTATAGVGEAKDCKEVRPIFVPSVWNASSLRSAGSPLSPLSPPKRRETLPPPPPSPRSSAAGSRQEQRGLGDGLRSSPPWRRKVRGFVL